MGEKAKEEQRHVFRFDRFASLSAELIERGGRPYRARPCPRWKRLLDTVTLDSDRSQANLAGKRAAEELRKSSRKLSEPSCFRHAVSLFRSVGALELASLFE